MLNIRDSLEEVDFNYILEHDDFTLAFCTFLDQFLRSNKKQEMIATPPCENNVQEALHLCLLAAMSHKLANDYGLDVPEWVHDPKYIMPYAVFAHGTEDIEYQEFLIADSPSEYATKNLFYGANVLKRA